MTSPSDLAARSPADHGNAELFAGLKRVLFPLDPKAFFVAKTLELTSSTQVENTPYSGTNPRSPPWAAQLQYPVGGQAPATAAIDAWPRWPGDSFEVKQSKHNEALLRPDRARLH